MELNRSYEVKAKQRDEYFDVHIRIPKSEIETSSKSSHEINMIFNQIFIFSEALKLGHSWTTQDTERSMNKIIADLKSLSNEVCWVKSIYKEIKRSMNE